MESYVERPPLPELTGVVRTVRIQPTGAAPYVQRHLPTGGVEIHFPIGGRPQLVGPLTGPEIEVIPAHTTIVACGSSRGPRACGEPRWTAASWTRWPSPRRPNRRSCSRRPTSCIVSTLDDVVAALDPTERLKGKDGHPRSPVRPGTKTRTESVVPGGDTINTEEHAP